MRDYIYLMSTTPWSEPCAQVGDENYMENSRLEARAYIAQLKRTFGENPPCTDFSIVKCTHDFGPYLDMRFYYDNEEQRHVEYMNTVECGCEKWDDTALAELKSAGYDISRQRKVIPISDKRAMLKSKGA